MVDRQPSVRIQEWLYRRGYLICGRRLPLWLRLRLVRRHADRVYDEIVGED